MYIRVASLLDAWLDACEILLTWFYYQTLKWLKFFMKWNNFLTNRHKNWSRVIVSSIPVQHLIAAKFLQATPHFRWHIFFKIPSKTSTVCTDRFMCWRPHLVFILHFIQCLALLGHYSPSNAQFFLFLRCSMMKKTLFFKNLF